MYQIKKFWNKNPVATILLSMKTLKNSLLNMMNLDIKQKVI